MNILKLKIDFYSQFFILRIKIDIFKNIFQYGEIEEMNVCDNLGDHLVGNVYVKVSFLTFYYKSEVKPTHTHVYLSNQTCSSRENALQTLHDLFICFSSGMRKMQKKQLMN